nr:50S ribosomal protein L7/L12 [Ipomoea batatas]GMD36202.1 50S ribosomal protein L7/L12 [Ipomoea batatas]
MKLLATFRSSRAHIALRRIIGPLQCRSFQPDFVPRDPNAKPRRYKYPAVYDPYGPRPPPSDKIIQLVERIASLTPEERRQIGPTLRERLKHPMMKPISVEGIDFGGGGGSGAGASKTEEKKAEKTVFDVKLEKFDAAAKIKVIKEVRGFTNLGLKEAKDLVEKVPAVLKQGVTKEEANDIIEKIKAAGGVAVMEANGESLSNSAIGTTSSRAHEKLATPLLTGVSLTLEHLHFPKNMDEPDLGINKNAATFDVSEPNTTNPHLKD